MDDKTNHEKEFDNIFKEVQQLGGCFYKVAYLYYFYNSFINKHF